VVTCYKKTYLDLFCNIGNNVGNIDEDFGISVGVGFDGGGGGGGRLFCCT
jgi:hypothetical protein